MLDSMNSLLMSAVTYSAYQGVLIAFVCMMAAACIAIIVVIMMQKGTSDNVSAVTGATQQDTFYGKNKAKDKESILKIVTLALFVFIIICAIICFVFGIRAEVQG